MVQPGPLLNWVGQMRRAGGALAQGEQAPLPKALAKPIKRGGAVIRWWGGAAATLNTVGGGRVRLLGWAEEWHVQQGS